MRFRFLIFAIAIFAAPLTAHAASIGFASSGILFSSEPSFAGNTIKVYSVVINNQYSKLTATVAFFDNNQAFGNAQVEVLLEEARQVQTQWTPTAGQHVVVAKFVGATTTDAQGNARRLSQAEIDSVAAPVSRTVMIDSDSDKDGIGDQDEIRTYHTAPLVKDSDGDGLSDYDEIFKYKTDPNKADTDGDGMNDGDEIKVGRNPLVPDAPLPPPLPPPVTVPIAPVPIKKQTPKTTIKKETTVKKSTEPVVVPVATTTATSSHFDALPPIAESAAEQEQEPEDTTKKWMSVLGVIALLLAVAAGASAILAWRERNKYEK